MHVLKSECQITASQQLWTHHTDAIMHFDHTLGMGRDDSRGVTSAEWHLVGRGIS